MQSDTKQTTRAADGYLLHIRSLESKIRESAAVMQRLVWVRLTLALPGLLLILIGLTAREASPWIWKIGVALFIGFLTAATWHETNLWRISQTRQKLYGYQRLLARCNRDWGQLNALPTEEHCQEYHSELSRDLDLFGDRSLYRWCSLAMTQSGVRNLCDWLTRWVPEETFVERQSAVQEIAADRVWRESFFETTCSYRNQQAKPEGLAQWCQEGLYFAKRQWVHWLTWLSPAVLLAGVVTIVFCKLQEYEFGQLVGLGMILGGAAANFLVTMVITGPIHDIFVKIGTANRELQSLVNMILAIKKLESKGPLLSRIRGKCFDEQHSAEQALAQLQRIMALAGMQRSPLMFIPYLFLQILFLWDVRILELLERWKLQYGGRAAGWLEAIGMTETLFSAATIANEYPSWVYPTSIDKKTIASTNANLLEITGVAHPLLKDASQVPNSLCISREKPLLLVTGSNMAGKSTLLRSVGVNSILSRLGAPVCAQSWSGAVCELASSIRVQDSLQDGVSFFMAELKRLRSVVDTAQKENHPGGKQMLILLDEILQGTNSRERQIAVEHVLDKLVECGCIVMTSTHDLEMAGNASIQRIAQVVHFREHFERVDGQEVMRFDYVMRAGVTPTTNALKLLEMVGLRPPR